MSSYFRAANFVDSDEEEDRSEEEVSEEEITDSEEEEESTKKKGFFNKAKMVDSDDEEGSDEESDEEDKETKKPAKEEPKSAQSELDDKRKKWFLENSDEEEESDYSDDEWVSEEEEEEEERAEVKSHREKYLDELREITEKVQDSIMDNNWKVVSDDIVEVGKVLEKIQKLDEYKGKKKVPNLYVRFLVYLEDRLEEAKDKKADLKTNDAKLLTTLYSKIKKANKPYEELMKACKTEPETYQDTEDEAEPVVKVKQPKTSSVPLNDIQRLMADLTSGTIEEKIAEIGRVKGYKGTNPKESLLQLKILLAHSHEPKTRIQLLLLIVLTNFDLPKGTNNYLSIDTWKNACFGLIRLVKLIEDHPELVIVESVDQTLGESLPEGETSEPNKAGQVVIKGNIASILERLYDEFITSLQYTDPHTQDYAKRLKDEYLLIEAGERVYTFYSKRNNKRNLARVAFKLFEHLYYRKQEDHDNLLSAQRTNALKSLEEAKENWIAEEKLMVSTEVTPTVDPFVIDSPDVIEPNLTKVLSHLSTIIYENGTEHSKIRTLLMHIYHRAVYGKFFEARNLLVTSKLQDTINHFDIPTQILFNRVIAQIGICAFKNGLIQESHSALLELYSSQKQKELLAQGLSSNRFQPQTGTVQKKEQNEKIERSRLIPYHQHISVDLIEGIHLICALLLEVPNMAMHSFSNVKPKVINKAFRRVLENFSRQHYVGQPENTKERINSAFHLLSSGAWEEAYKTLLALEDIWSLIPDNEPVKEMLKKKVKVAALKAYIFKYSRHYETFSVDLMAKMFDLPSPSVHSIVNKMIISEEFYAAFDQTNNTIVVYHSAPTPLQYLALQLSDKISSLVEYNEKLYEAKQSNTAYVVMTDHKQAKRSKQKNSKQNQNQKGNRTNNNNNNNKHNNQRKHNQKKEKTEPAAVEQK
ncbi:eukaryotic translation initiation factor 3 [Naegleria gruberi]|uniref:Eukaryotic translation initiation factor 3 n=1 Tax=Naegleria gruberi TaxID=5762 RepID=D2V723_NAEGR|nr:eukaryotic translation initiation factor 3 [Naegleria gruberi]EFC47295.1 eukaryotic translation initiation factor 3 [Naegleria gruberi]|eukprot:XP_002680039.1 eukaryotic translation initiation factor 3 [Naegleria gruberi strain NEG-M]